MSAHDININSLRIEGTSIEPWNPDYDEINWNLNDSSDESTVPRRPLTFNPHHSMPSLVNNNHLYEEEEEDDGSIISPLPQVARMSPILLSRAPEAQDDDFTREISSSLRDEISGLEGTQNALLEQIRDLEIAHDQLEAARSELVQVLATLEETRNEYAAREALDNAHRRIAERFERYSSQQQERTINPFDIDDDEEDPNEFYEDILSTQQGLGIIPSVQRLGFPRTVPIGEDPTNILETFLDSNGEVCLGLEDCLQRAVGWSGEKSDFLEYGIDRDGEAIQDRSTITIHDKTFEAPIR